MKKLYNIAIVLAALSAALSCHKETTPDSVASDLVGEWHLTETETEGIVIDPLTDVYLTICVDCTFEIYQKSGDQSRYTKFTGTCKSVKDILSGTYSSGTEWGTSYIFDVSGDTLTLITEDGMEIQTWTKESLDQAAKDEADISTRSIFTAAIPFL